MQLKGRSYFGRQGVAPSEGFFERIPELRPLRGSSVAVFGLGCVGAPSVLEFARAGVGELRFVDHDIIDPGTTVRWPLGIKYAGKEKVKVLREFIQANYPHTTIHEDHALRHKLGAVRLSGAKTELPSEKMVVAEILEGVSLIYDATAEVGVNHYLSDYARTHNIPYLCVSATMGGWGGFVCRVRPNSEGCWMCFRHAENDGVISTYPPHDEAGTVQPKGCSDPTFTGAGFDMAFVALTGVRVAISTLCEGHAGGY